MYVNVLIFWKKILFILPAGAAAKKYLTETTKLMNSRRNNLSLRDIAFKAIHIISCISCLAFFFKSRANVNGALKLLTNNMSNGIIHLDGKSPKAKHPASSELNEELLLRREKLSVNPTVFEDIDKNMVKVHHYRPKAVLVLQNYPVDIYLLKVNNRNNKTRCEICSKLTIKTPERRISSDKFSSSLTRLISEDPQIPQVTVAIFFSIFCFMIFGS